MKVFNDNGKVVFDGAFDASKIDFNDEETELGEDFMNIGLVNIHTLLQKMFTIL